MDNRLRKISFCGIFIALIMAFGYALAYIPNFEIVTLLIFLSGYLMGKKFGVFIGFLGEFLFSALNPMGSGLLFPPTLIAQVIAMGFTGLMGGIIGDFLGHKQFSKKYVFLFAVIGAFVTLIYDLIVSLAYPISAGFDISETLGIMLSGLVFSIMHIVTNTIVFSTLLPVIIIRIKKSGLFNEYQR